MPAPPCWRARIDRDRVRLATEPLTSDQEAVEGGAQPSWGQPGAYAPRWWELTSMSPHPKEEGQMLEEVREQGWEGTTFD